MAKDKNVSITIGELTDLIETHKVLVSALSVRGDWTVPINRMNVIIDNISRKTIPIKKGKKSKKVSKKIAKTAKKIKN